MVYNICRYKTNDSKQLKGGINGTFITIIKFLTLFLKCYTINSKQTAVSQYTYFRLLKNNAKRHSQKAKTGKRWNTRKQACIFTTDKYTSGTCNTQIQTCTYLCVCTHIYACIQLTQNKTGKEKQQHHQKQKTSGDTNQPY